MTIKGKWHFIGVGGVGMSGIAKACHELGATVSGSDLSSSLLTEQLSQLGVKIHIGSHCESSVSEDADVVVISSAIRKDNKEYRAAIDKNVEIIRRGTCLARLMEYKSGIAVAGAHGKTTTSSMIAFLLERGGLDPAFFIGAYVGNFGTNAKWGQGEYMVAETDESDGSFLELIPDIALVTNVEDDHMDHYGSQENIDQAFADFINSCRKKAVLCSDDPGLRRIEPLLMGIGLNKRLTYGFCESADFRGESLRYEDGEMQAEVYKRNELLGTLSLCVFGRHNMQNALGAICVGMECGLSFAEMKRIMRDFRGVQRRFELLGTVENCSIYDDYGHHPTEIKATLSAAKAVARGRIVAVFQPHRYTRTRQLAKEFGMSFDLADEVLLLPIYCAGETPIPGVDTNLIAESMLKDDGGKIPLRADEFDEACLLLERILKPGDLVLTLGAGNVRKVGEALMERLSKKDRADNE